MKVIVDTCVWSRFFRGALSSDDRTLAELRSLIREDSVQMLGCIRQELLSGAQPQQRFYHIRDYLRHYPNLPVDEEDDENAAAYYNLCRSKGIQGGPADFLICALAVRHRMAILTTDSDFDGFAQRLPILLHKGPWRR